MMDIRRNPIPGFTNLKLVLRSRISDVVVGIETAENAWEEIMEIHGECFVYFQHSGGHDSIIK